ncbi:MAG: glycoside hydrolase family 43 protein, partial [Dorea sp.]|nr:glycoside hydrolase family 43 protein [Dorea sp.]
MKIKNPILSGFNPDPSISDLIKRSEIAGLLHDC